MSVAFAEMEVIMPRGESPPTEIRFEPIPYDEAYEACDGHASGDIRALVTVLLPSGGLVKLCGHHARSLGYDHTLNAEPENRLKGSAN